MKTLTTGHRSEINDFHILPKPPGTSACLGKCQKHSEADRKWVLTPAELIFADIILTHL